MTVRNLVQGNKFLISLNVVLAGCFVVYHVFLDQYYCLSADDFAGIDYASQGIPGLSLAWHFYFAWEGPFLNHFIHGLLMWLVSIGVPPILVLGLVKVSMIGSCLVLMSAVSTRFYLNWDRQQAIFSALVFTLVLYIISPEQTQIWHWLTGMVYLYPLIFLMLGFAAVLRKRFWWAIAALAFVMQSRATYAVLIFGFVVLLTMFYWWKKEENRKQWVLLSAFLFLFLALYLIAPGNYVRTEEQGGNFSVVQFKMGLRNLFISFNIAKIDRVLLGLLAVLPWAGFRQKKPKPKQLWQWAIPFVLYVGFAIVHETLFVSITGCREWERVLSLHSFLFLSMMFVYGFWIFSFVPASWKKTIQFASVIGIVGLLFKLYTGFGYQLEMGKELKINYDARMVSITNYEGIGDTLYVKPLVYKGILYFEDFSENPDWWINYDFQKANELNFKVATEKQHEQ